MTTSIFFGQLNGVYQTVGMFLFSYLINPILLNWISTRGPFPLLFLEIASPAGKRITLVGETIFRGLPAPEEE